MNMLEISKCIDRRPENESWVDLEQVASGLELRDYEEYAGQDQERLKAYWITRHYDSGYHLGVRMYFFDGVPVAVSERIGRKFDEEFEWFSQEAADQVRDYVVSLIVREKHEVALCNLEQDLGDSFKIDYVSEVIDWDRARYEGRPVEVVEIEKEPNDFYGFRAKIHIQVPETGEALVVGVRDLDFAFFLDRNSEKDKITEEESLEDKIKEAERMKTASSRDEGPGTAELCRD